MKRITLPKIRRALETMHHEVTIDPAVAARGAPRGRAHAGDPRRTRWNDPLGTGRPIVVVGGGVAGLVDGAAPGAAPGDA